jgi:hypothetical protein
MCLLWSTNWVFIYQKTTFFIVTAVRPQILHIIVTSLWGKCGNCCPSCAIQTVIDTVQSFSCGYREIFACAWRCHSSPSSPDIKNAHSFREGEVLHRATVTSEAGTLCWHPGCYFVLQCDVSPSSTERRALKRAPCWLSMVRRELFQLVRSDGPTLYHADSNPVFVFSVVALSRRSLSTAIWINYKLNKQILTSKQYEQYKYPPSSRRNSSKLIRGV